MQKHKFVLHLHLEIFLQQEEGELAIAIIIGMVVATLGVFTYLNMGATPKIFWTGPNVVIGGLLFGFGIVIAGGCEVWMDV